MSSENKLDYLFARYFEQSITPEELSELKALMNEFDNESLDKHLRSIWVNNEYLPLYPSEKQTKRMIGRIEQAISDEKVITVPIHRPFTRIFSRVAAILILVLLSSTSFYLYRSNQSLSLYRDSQIALTVGNGQEASFTLPDGTLVRLNSGSALRYDNNFGENNRYVDFSGEALFDVKKDEGRPFIVSTKHINIEVLGTTFNMYAYDSDELVEMTLLTGSVRASSKKQPECQVLVKPNEKVICNISTGKLTVEQTNTQYETAWINGEIVFKSERLSNVLLKLERKYGVHIRYDANVDLLDDRFSGRISKNSNIGDVMKILTNHYPLKYEYKDDVFVLFN